MRSVTIAPIVLSFAVALAGCAGGMDVAECQTADWRTLGYEDGAAGRGMESFSSRRKACSEHGVKPDFAAYQAGRDKGLALFCRPGNGYRLGVRGYRYNGVCPDGQESAFLAAHSDGYGLYTRRAAVTRIEKQLRKKKKRADRIEVELVEKTTKLVSAGIEVSRRAAIGVQIKQLADEKVSLGLAIERLEQDRVAAVQDYEDYSHRIGDYRGS